MSKSTFSDAFAEHEAQHKNAVMQDTWGHLFPKGFYYEGTVIIAQSLYNDVVILKEQIEIEGSPWWYDAIHNFVYDIDFDEGEVYEVKIAVKIVNEDGELSFQISELSKRKVL